MSAGARTGRHGPRGLTLLEVLATLAVLAVLALLALPSVSAMAQRQQLAAAAEGLAADLAEARMEAARSGQALHVQSQAGTGTWCWAVATQAGCDCQAPAAPQCRLKAVQASHYPGIALLQPVHARFEPQGTAQAGQGNAAAPSGSAWRADLQSGQGDRLRVELATLGRSRICVPRSDAGPAHGPGAAALARRYPAC